MVYNSRLFCDTLLSDYIDSLFNEIRELIYSHKEDYILSVNEEDFVNYIKSKYTIECPEIKIDKAYIENDEKKVVENSLYKNGKIESKCLIIRYCIPIVGDYKLLQYQPNFASFSTGEPSRVFWSSDCLYAEFNNYYNDPQSIRGLINDFNERLLSNLEKLLNQLEDSYTTKLEEFIINVFQDYKQQIKKKNEFVEAIGIPLRSNINVSTTFSVPSPKMREKIQVTHPPLNDTAFKPEPVLDKTNYQKILSLINDAGKNFERMPSVYLGKHEEDLRDHILFVLDPNFEMGNASGETFNKKGKTDIQLRYNSSVVFIAECKFWTGEKNYLKTIDQLLNYLTWRDSKAAIIVFSKNKEFTNVLSSIKEFTPRHSNFLREEMSQSETWFNYKIHINGDRNRQVNLAVLAFHIPKIS